MRTFDQKPPGACTPLPCSLVRSTTPTAAPDPHAERSLSEQPAIGHPAVPALSHVDSEQRAGGPASRPTSGAHAFGTIAVYPQGRAAPGRQLTIRPAGDRYEHEADQIAEAVMRMPARAQAGAAASWGSAAPAHNTNQPQRSQPTTAASALTFEGGRSLPAATRGFFESRFGQDFSQVRIHTDAPSADLARAVHAQAFTLGRDIVFGAGEFQDGTQPGQRLIAHELAHVVQQRNGAVAGTIQRQVPAAAPAPAAPPPCRTPERVVVESKGSDRFLIVDVEPPCYACPNSPDDTCPKLAQKIFPPTATGPVQFSWQVRFLTLPGPNETAFSKNRYVIQKLEKNLTFSTPPAATPPYTALYWEAFELNTSYETEIDYWQFEIPDLTAGTWEWKATLYLTEQLPTGMAAGTVPDAAGAPSTTSEPKGLGRVYGTRRIAGKFDFTSPNKWHSYQ